MGEPEKTIVGVRRRPLTSRFSARIAMVSRRALVALFGLVPAACATAPTGGLRVEHLLKNLDLVRIADTIWVHVSEDSTQRYGRLPANGLLILGDPESLLVDTGWNVEQTRRIAAFAEELGHPIRKVILTHGHPDRVGGLEALLESDVVVLAQEVTARSLGAPAGRARIETYATEAEVSVGHTRVEVLYPGPGHTVDNAVVYIPDARILFGGCLVKAATSPDLGNREDAVLAAWPLSVMRLLERYPKTELVIPGHGPPGSIGLLHHTLGLLEQELSTLTPN